MAHETVDLPVLHVPARDIPIPVGLSPEAKAHLARGKFADLVWPEQDDIAAWRALIAEMDRVGLETLTMLGAGFEGTVEEIDAGGARVHVVTPACVAADDSRVFVDFHGGSMIWGGGPSCAAMGKKTAESVGARVWAVDYRTPPDHPYPEPLDDCVAAYRALLERTAPENIIIGGASAGGNFAAATILRARDEGLPLPAAAVLLTPELDLTESGDTFSTLLGVDTALTARLMPANLLYAGGHDLADPYVSPLFGDFTKGFPPTFLQSGTRDLFLSNTVRMHRALRQAGIEAELHVFEAATHVMFMSGPEAEDRKRETRGFVDRIWGRS
ncbi:MAG: alpha/beta hydrolase [Novosphingobium sp.]|nr:alpha/beta hydrolase [Novosphingobium sp.]